MRMSPNIDTYGYLERDGLLSLFFFFLFLPIPSEYANTWLLVFDNGSCPLKHISYNCDALHLPVLWRENSSRTFSSYFQMNLISSAPFLYQTLNSLAPCSSHFKGQCRPLSAPTVLYFCPSALPSLALVFFILQAMLGGSILFWLGSEDSYREFPCCPFPFPKLFAVGKWGEQRRFPTSHRTEQSFQALCAPSYPLDFSRGWIKSLSRARNCVCFLNGWVWDHKQVTVGLQI